MSWFKRSMPIDGSVLFRGSLPPRLADLRLPADATVTPGTPDSRVHWRADASSPTLGEARLICLRDPPLPPRELFAFDGALTPDEREQTRLGGALVNVRIEQSKGDLLRDRKRLLTWLGSIFDDAGLIAMDHASTRGWSRAMLDDELSHDADVDVSALYAVHAVTKDGRCEWLHTHGLATLGKVDFDILRPAEPLTSNAADMVRSIAFKILEGTLKTGTPDSVAFRPNGTVAAIDAGAFDASAPADERAIRDMGPDDDGVHTRDRIVLIDPPAKPSLLGRLFGGRRGGVRASRALSNFPGDRAIVFFSHDASALAAERARKTWPLFRAARAEFADLPFTPIVKLAYRVDGGGEFDLEHLWFEVHAAGDETVDATLLNEPFNISEMHEGQRGTHPISIMSDWQIITPAGSITPRDSSPLRKLRENPAALAEIRKMLAERGENA